MSTEVTPSAAKVLFLSREFDRKASHEKALNMLRGIITADAEKAKVKWNFDIVNDVPLVGAVKWGKGDDRYDWIGIVSAGSNGANETEEVRNSINGDTPGEGSKSVENGKEP